MEWNKKFIQIAYIVLYKIHNYAYGNEDCAKWLLFTLIMY